MEQREAPARRLWLLVALEPFNLPASSLLLYWIGCHILDCANYFPPALWLLLATSYPHAHITAGRRCSPESLYCKMYAF